MRFQKLNLDFSPMPDDTRNHAFILDTALNLIHPVNYIDDGEDVTHAQALELAAACDFGGKTDWQLCDIHELQPLVNFGFYDPATDPALLPGATSDWVWTRTPCAWRPAGSAFLCVYFYYGLVYGYVRDFQARVRVCRSALPAGQ
jgi:hypothetical protein